MLKARNRKLSMILVLAMLMTMFAGLGTASAAGEFRAASVPTVADGAGKTLGTIIIDMDYYDASRAQEFVINLPGDFEFPGSGGKIGDVTLIEDAGTVLAGTAVGAITKLSATKALVTIGVFGITNVAEFVAAVPLQGITVPKSAPAEINVTLVNQPGSDFSDGLLLVARTSGGQVQASAGDPVTVTSAGSDDKVSISFRENKAGAIEVGAKALELKLPKGFSWAKDFTFAQVTSSAGDDELLETYPDDRTMRIERTLEDTLDPAVIWNVKSNIDVDESVAKFGDVVVTISGKSSVSPNSVTVGTYADFGIKIDVDDPETELIAGRIDQEISDFTISEEIAASLINNRTVYMTLPDGCRWAITNEDEKDADKYFADLSPDADGTLSIKDNEVTVLKNKEESARFTVLNDMAYAAKGEIEISNALIDVAVDFTGSVTIKFWGNAGLTDEITVGNVVAPISATADAKDVKIGLQSQEAGDIIITESDADMIQATYYDADEDETLQAALVLEAPKNVDWASIPTVEVIEGDLEINTVTREDNVLTMTIRSASSVASKIQISDIKYTVDRTVPEGKATVSIKGNALNQSMFLNRGTAAKVVPAICVTPAPGETVGNGEFRIGSNIYYVGGVAKVMDVAPYIKGDRTYVPMRYLGEILGAEVVWDDAARTVTLTKGETTVVFTIGSTAYTVNGEAKTADVAPEIASDRTMLPARFVAEAFGAVVGWDAATQTVLISQ